MTKVNRGMFLKREVAYIDGVGSVEKFSVVYCKATFFSNCVVYIVLSILIINLT